MKSKTGELVVEHFKDFFGSEIADVLLNQYFEKYKIHNFDSLSNKDKVMFGQRVLGDVFGKFYPKKKVQNLQLLYLFRFSLNDAISKVEDMIKRKSSIKLYPITEIDSTWINEFIEEVTDENFEKFIFEFSSSVSGFLVMSMHEKNAIDLASIMMKSMVQDIDINEYLDDMKRSAVNELFNILIPDFIKIISEMYDLKIYYVPLNYREFQFRCDVTRLRSGVKLVKTKLDISISDFSIPIKAFIILDVPEKINFNKVTSGDEESVIVE